MASEKANMNEREEVEALLPWFVTKRLDRADEARVESYLVMHPEMRTQLALVNDEHHATVKTNEATAVPRSDGLQRLRSSIAAERPIADKLAKQANGWFEQLCNIFVAPTSMAVKWAGAAAAVIVMLQAVTIGSLLTVKPTDSTPYTTATGKEAGTPGTFVLVQFVSIATATDIARLLETTGAEIVAGPKPGGIFQIRLSKNKLTDDERNAIVRKMQGHKKLIGRVFPYG